MEHEFIGELEADETLPVFAPERRQAEMVYSGLRCPCGCHVFRLSGWPWIVSGSGGFFWRSLARVWREARQPTEVDEAIGSAFKLPLTTRCDACERKEKIFARESRIGDHVREENQDPMESIRCPVCRRGRFELIAGVERDEVRISNLAIEVVIRCHACHRQARIATSEGGPSAQQVRLDRLYGRR